MQSVEKCGRIFRGMTFELKKKWLTVVTKHLTDDPVEQFSGAFSSHVSDWPDNHDTYLGKTLMGTE